MRRNNLLLLALASAFCISVLTPLGASAVTYADARDIASDRILFVSSFMQSNPEDPGGVPAWAKGTSVPGAPVLVCAYPDLEPSYYYVPVLDEGGTQTSFVTLGAADGHVQAYGEVRDGKAYPVVTRDEAADLASSVLGIELSPEDLVAVSMPNRMLYWYPKSLSSRGPIFINLGDASDIHTRLDLSLTPPDVIADPVAEAEEMIAPARPTDLRYPTSYDLSVPHHYQGTSYHCGPASVEMVFDYWGPDIDQTDIGHVANCTPSAGSYASDNRRAGHFSCLSSAVLDPALYGYSERWLGYGSCENQWSNGGTSDPDYATRYTDLYELIYAGYPIEVLTFYDATHSTGHFRVVKGYNNSTDVFIVHDPWYTAPYQGPNVNFDQTFFVDDLWTRYYRWGALMSPWKVEVSAPATVFPGAEFTLSVDVHYCGPHPFESQYSASSVVVEPVLPSGFVLAPGESSDKPLPGLGASGSTGSASWQVIASCDAGSESIGAVASGQVSGSSQSYSSYGDVIGGEGEDDIEVVAGNRVIYVDVGGGGDFLTIQAGIDDARCDGDMVLVQPGDYVGAGNRNLDFGTRNLTLMSAGDPGNTFIDCQLSGRGIYLHGGQDTTTVISGFSIAAGKPSGTFTYGGGIFCDGASPKLSNMAIVECQANYGAGMAWMDASPRLSDVHFIHNTAVDYGGGIYAIRDSMGGRLEGVYLMDNSAGTLGGGIYDTYNTFSLYDCVIHGNSAGFGGGMYIGRSAPNITRAQVQWNSATTSGGALFIPYESEAAITRSNIIHNTTGNASYGAIQSNDSQPTISQCIIGYNWGGGGGLGCAGPKLPTTYHSLSYANAGGDSLCGTHHDNLFRDPYFCDEPGEDFTLHSDSPCLPSYNPWSVQIGVFGEGGCGYAGIDDGQQVRALSLGRPVPNPSAGSMSIDYQAPRSSSSLQVAVYDLAGRLVRVLADGAPDAYSGRLVWDGADERGRRVASGVYFIRATNSGETVGRKLVVLR